VTFGHAAARSIGHPMSYISLQSAICRRTPRAQGRIDRRNTSRIERSPNHIKSAAWCRAALAAAITVAVIALPASARADGPFSGPYIGVNAGGAWGRTSFATNPNCPPSIIDATFCNSSPDPSAPNGVAVAASGTGRLSPSGFTGGVQAGYNLQRGVLVLGAEADLGAFRLAESTLAAGLFPVTFLGNQYTLTETMKANWLATVRGRLGISVMQHVLLYATGGVAFSEFKFSSGYGDNAVGFGFPGGNGFGAKSDMRTGWTAGGGVEWLLDRNWSIKAEYLYVDLGSMNFLVPVSNTAAFSQTMQVNADLTAQIARLGLNFRF
jgi:outer membrane immunogenic protein